MSVSTVQKITFISCLMLCVSLFLPKIFLSRGQKEIVQSEVGPGHVPPLRYSQPFSEDHDHWQAETYYAKSYNPEAFSKTAGKPKLLGQVIPVYGFGIFLYIIYIFIKLTYKDKSPKPECRFPIWTAEFTMQEIPDYEMTQLQARLRQMERRASKAVHPPARSRRGSRRREQRKLRQLRDITRVMLEGRPLEGVSPEVEAEETPYSADWEGYSEETYPQYEVAFLRRRYPSVILEEPDMDALTAEELAERMEREEEEEEEEEDEEEDDIDDEEMEEFENGLDEDELDASDDNQTESKSDGKTKETEDEEDGEDGDDEEEEEDEEDKGPEEEESDVEALEIHEHCHLEVQTQEEEEEEEEEEVGEDEPCLPRNRSDEDEGSTGARKAREKKQITFSDHRRVFHYPKGGRVGLYEDEEVKEDTTEGSESEEEEEEVDEEEEEEEEEEDKQDGDVVMEEVVREEEDPLMEAESLAFRTEVESDPDEQELDLMDFLLTYQPETTPGRFSQSEAPRSPIPASLRKRHKKQKKKN